MRGKVTFFCTILLICGILCGTKKVAAEESSAGYDDMFTLELKMENLRGEDRENVDLEGIRVDVYASEVTNYYEDSCTTEYTHRYAFSVYTDANGRVRFLRPSEQMVLRIEPETLPSNVRITVGDRFYKKEVTHDVRYISRVEKTEIEKDACMEVKAGGAVTAQEPEYPFSENGFTETGDAHDLEERGENRDNFLFQDPDNFNQRKTYGNFLICYNSASSITPAFVTSLATVLLEADSSLVDELSLNRPRSDSQGDTQYQVFIMASGQNDQVNLIRYEENGVRYSQIILNGITNLNASMNLTLQGDVIHEYMHAIIHTYSENVPGWFQEGWSEWAKKRVMGVNSLETTGINNYLAETYKSFIESGQNDYGKVLMPLYIEQNYGACTVANAVKNLATSAGAMAAISNALPSGVTFQSMFPNFMAYNYAPRYFYQTHSSNWSSHPFISSVYTLNRYPENAYGGMINPYAAHYREFEVPSSGSYNLDITIRITDNVGSLSAKLHMSNSAGIVTNWSFLPGQTYVTYSTSIGALYSKGALSITNTSNNTTNYYITIARN